MKIHSCNVHESGFFFKDHNQYSIVLAFMILYVKSHYNCIHTGKEKSLMPAQSKLLDTLLNSPNILLNPWRVCVELKILNHVECP